MPKSSIKQSIIKKMGKTKEKVDSYGFGLKYYPIMTTSQFNESIFSFNKI